jgi:hypothetical protein
LHELNVSQVQDRPFCKVKIDLVLIVKLSDLPIKYFSRLNSRMPPDDTG